MFRTLVLTVCIACNALAAKGHEFWIDPVAYQVAPGEEVVANIRVGQQYDGAPYSYIPRNFRRFEYVLNGELAPVEGKVGDRPAMTVTPEGEGLLVAIYVSSDMRLTWDSWEKFTSFLEHKDLTWGLAEHDARGLSHEDVRERYSRYAKSLIAVGVGAGEDAEAGLETEFVALENPFTDDMSDGFDVRVLYQGEPRADSQVEVFQKSSDGSVEIFTERTDAEGKVTIPVKPGHRYMLDSVVLRPLEKTQERDPVWETVWANLTFEIPSP